MEATCDYWINLNEGKTWTCQQKAALSMVYAVYNLSSEAWT